MKLALSFLIGCALAVIGAELDGLFPMPANAMAPSSSVLAWEEHAFGTGVVLHLVWSNQIASRLSLIGSLNNTNWFELMSFDRVGSNVYCDDFTYINGSNVVPFLRIIPSP